MQSFILVSIFPRSSLVPLASTMIPINTRLFVSSSLLMGFNFRFASFKLERTCHICSNSTSLPGLCTLTSSTKTIRNWFQLHFKDFIHGLRQCFNTSILSPKGIIVLSYILALIIIVVLCTSFIAILICQKLDCKSKALKICSPFNYINKSSIRGRG